MQFAHLKRILRKLAKLLIRPPPPDHPTACVACGQ
jgi:hypothetical protein